MKLTEVTEYDEIYCDEIIAALVGMCMFNPNEGKIQNVAQSVYSKQQGNFYKIEEDGQVIGILGTKRVDRKCEIFQIAIRKDMQRKNKGTQVIKLLKEINKGFIDQYFTCLKVDSEEFFIKNGFVREEVKVLNPDFDMSEYIGVLNV